MTISEALTARMDMGKLQNWNPLNKMSVILLIFLGQNQRILLDSIIYDCTIYLYTYSNKFFTFTNFIANTSLTSLLNYPTSPFYKPASRTLLAHFSLTSFTHLSQWRVLSNFLTYLFYPLVALTHFCYLSYIHIY